MKKVKVISNNTRGFLRNLFDYQFEDYCFEYNKKGVFEKKGTLKRKILGNIISWKIFDYLGVFQVIRGNYECDLCFSFNRFARINKPYIIYLENPGALVHYCWNRPRSLITKMRIKKYLSDENLKAIICMSDACKNTLDTLYELPQDLKIERIYPLICDDNTYREADISGKFREDTIDCLFIAEYFRLKGGRDLLELFKKVEMEDLPYQLTVVTALDGLDQYEKNELEKNKKIKLYDFVLTKNELCELYKKTAILLNPTRWDSSSLVTLEAMKYGCMCVGTGIYAIREMSPEVSYKYFKSPKMKYWNDDNSINKDVAMNMRNTIRTDYIDSDLVTFMYNHLRHLSQNRKELHDACLEAYRLSRGKDFGEEAIVSSWNDILEEALDK